MLPKKQRKIAVMGFRGVGKSTVTIQFVDKIFTEMYNPTIENTFNTIIKCGGDEYATEIIDTAGQDEFSSFQRTYATGVHGYVLVYSVTSKNSFEMVKIINDKILNYLGTEKVPRVLVGNKKDLHYEREVNFEEGKALADSWGCAFIETSAKENENIDNVFQLALQEIQKEQTPEEPKSSCVLM